MKRSWKIAIGTLLSALVLGAGAVASAGPGFHGGPGGRHGQMMNRMIDGALDEAKATPEQRARIHAARDKAVEAMKSRKHDRGEGMEKALRLFEQDRVDRSQLDALRAEREADMRAVSDAIGDALLEAHATLTPEQRHVVAEYVRSHKPQRGKHGPRADQ